MGILVTKHLDTLTCLACGRPGEESWSADWYDVASTKIKISKVLVEADKGKAYPEDQFGERLEVDLCPVCFEQKLLPWLRAQRAKVEWEDYG